MRSINVPNDAAFSSLGGTFVVVVDFRRWNAPTQLQLYMAIQSTLSVMREDLFLVAVYGICLPPSIVT